MKHHQLAVKKYIAKRLRLVGRAAADDECDKFYIALLRRKDKGQMDFNDAADILALDLENPEELKGVRAAYAEHLE